MVWFNGNRTNFDFIETNFQENAYKQRSPPEKKWIKWFGFDNHNSKSASLDAKFGLIISWFSSSVIILFGVYFLKKALPMAGR